MADGSSLEGAYYAQQREAMQLGGGGIDQWHQDRFVQRLVLILEQRGLRDAMRVLNDDEEHDGLSSAAEPLLDYFRRRMNALVLGLLDDGYDEHEIFHDFRQLVIRIGHETADAVPDGESQSQPYRNGGGFGAVPAPASSAAVRSLLEKQTFRAASCCNHEDLTECSICFEEFVDGEQVSVMPCPCRGHRFHSDCIAKWLGISNMCPLCRHELPTLGCAYDQ